MKRKIRENSIDIARGIAIILVVIGHCDNFTSISLERFCGLFFMPLFIFLSGYLSKIGSINNLKELFSYIFRKTKKLYLFYLKYEILFLILRNIFFRVGFLSSNIEYGGKFLLEIHSLPVFLKNLILVIFGMGREPFCGAFWFIISLIFIIVMSGIINYIVNKLKTKKQLFEFILYLFFFILGIVMRYTISIPRFSPAFTMCIFYYLGILYSRNVESIKFNSIYIIFIAIINLIVLYQYSEVSLNSNFFTNPLLLLISSLSGIYLVISVSKFIDLKTVFMKKILCHIGKNTLYIIAYHFLGFKIVMYIQYLVGSIKLSDLAYLKGYNNNNIFYIFYVLFGVFFPLLINKIVTDIKNTKCERSENRNV